MQEISCEDFFAKFDENDLALLVQDETASGDKSNLKKVVRRQTAEKKAS